MIVAAPTSWLESAAGLALLLAVVGGVQWLYELATRPAAMKHARPRVWARGSVPLLRTTLPLAQNTHRILDWLLEQSELVGGQPFWTGVVGEPSSVVLSTPEHFEEVLKTHFETFGKGPLIEMTQDLFGDGIFAVDGAKWFHQRKTGSNLFSLRSLRESMAESVQHHTIVFNKILQRAAQQPDTPIDMFSLFNRFTMEAFAEIAFGVQLGSLNADADHPFQAAFDRAQRVLGQRFVRPKWLWKAQRYFSVGLEHELKESIRVIDDMVLGIVSQSLENRRLQTHVQSMGETKKRDIVSLFLDGVSADGATESGEAFDPKFLRDIVVNFLIAGRDTTAQALSWFFYSLSEHPRVVAKIRDELAAKLPELLTGEIATPSMEQAQQLVYLEAALRETLRLHPSLPANLRTASKDVMLKDGTFVREGEIVIVPSYVLGRMTSVWGADAKEFKPERWIDASSGKLIAVSAFQFNAFHAGPRTCLGMNLALMEMSIVAATVLSQFRLELAPGQSVTYDFSLTHPVKGELLMHVLPAVTVA